MCIRDSSIDAGRTVTIQVSFTGVRAYPDYNMLTFAAFGEDAHEPLLTQRLSLSLIHILLLIIQLLKNMLYH